MMIFFHLHSWPPLIFTTDPNGWRTKSIDPEEISTVPRKVTSSFHAVHSLGNAGQIMRVGSRHRLVIYTKLSCRRMTPAACRRRRNASAMLLRHCIISLSTQSAEQVHVRCRNCKAAAHTTPFLACDSCRNVQPVDPSVDYFRIFGLPDGGVPNTSHGSGCWPATIHESGYCLTTVCKSGCSDANLHIASWSQALAHPVAAANTPSTWGILWSCLWTYPML